jgi:nitrate/nitrite-specific signal transduction histidine kinase
MQLMSFVRDNGCGINSEAVQNESDWHWGPRGMRERAENIGARFGIWSGTGGGTEVCVAIPVDVTKRQPMPESVRSLSRGAESEAHDELKCTGR